MGEEDSHQPSMANIEEYPNTMANQTFTIGEEINISNKILRLIRVFRSQHCKGLFFISFSVTEYLTCQIATFFSKAPISFSNLSYSVHFSLLLLSTHFLYLCQLSTICEYPVPSQKETFQWFCQFLPLSFWRVLFGWFWFFALIKCKNMTHNFLCIFPLSGFHIAMLFRLANMEICF